VSIKLFKVLTLNGTLVGIYLGETVANLSTLTIFLYPFLLSYRSLEAMAACAARVGILRGLQKSVVPTADIPAFLCPGLLRITNISTRICHLRHSQPSSRHASRRLLTSQTKDAPEAKSHAQLEAAARYKALARVALPRTCPGCGALSQSVLQDEAGYYDLSRRAVRKYITGTETNDEAVTAENAIIKKALENAGDIAARLDFAKREKERPGMFGGAIFKWNK
jgi:hypothetical protein